MTSENVKFGKTFVLELADRVARSWWRVVAGACLGAAAGLTALHFIPRIYEARTLILVTPQRIPQEYVRSAIVDDINQRVGALREAVLSRPYMVKIIEDSFAPVPSDEAVLERLIASVANRVTVQTSREVFSISFRDRNPDRAARVVNMLSDIYIEENTKYRVSATEEITETLDGMASRAAADLKAQEDEIAAFKAAHLDETGDQRNFNLAVLTAKQKELESKESQLALAREHFRSMEEWEAQAYWAPSAGGETPAGAPRVAELRRDLTTLRERYSEDHPEVRAKKRQLDEAIAASSGPAAEPGGDAKPAATRGSDPAAAQKAAVASEIRLLEADVERLKRDVAVYRARMENAPLVEARLAELSKGLDVLRDKYRSALTRLENSKDALLLEETRKGEQFEVLERAVVPALPVFPSPILLVAAGTLVGLLVFVLPIVVREAVSPRVNSEAGLRRLAEVPVFITIPRFESPGTLREDRTRRLRNWGLSAACVLLLGSVIVIFRVL